MQMKLDNMRELPFLTAEQLIERLNLQPMIDEIYLLSGVDQTIRDALYTTALTRLIESCQLRPGSATHHHAIPGGLIIHTLELTLHAMKLRKGKELPLGASPEAREKELHQWTYAVFAAGLLHDIGKSITYRIVVNEDNSPWMPYARSLPHNSTYRIEFLKVPYSYHQNLALSFYGSILPISAQAWLAKNDKLMMQLLACLWGDEYNSGVIGEMIKKADQRSVANNLKLERPELTFDPGSKPAYEYLMLALRSLVESHEFVFNRSGGIGWTDDKGYAYLVCRPAITHAQQYLQGIGVTSIPQDPVRCFDLLLDGQQIIPTDDHKSVWKIRISSDRNDKSNFSHDLTVLKFEATALFKAGHAVKPFTGTITAIDADARETPTQKPAESMAEQNALSGMSSDTEHAKPAAHAADKAAPQYDEKPPARNAGEEKPAAGHAEHEKPPAKQVAEDETVIHGADAGDEQNTTGNAYALPPVSKRSQTRKAQQAQSTFKASSAEQPADVAAGTVIIQDTQENNTLEIGQDELSLKDKNIGKHFFEWLREGLAEGTVQTNHAGAHCHIVNRPGSTGIQADDLAVLLVSPAIFKDFIEERGLPDEYNNKPAYKRIQDRFGTHPGINIRSPAGLNVHAYWVGKQKSGSRNRINGYLIPVQEVYGEARAPDRNEFISPDLKE